MRKTGKALLAGALCFGAVLAAESTYGQPALDIGASTPVATYLLNQGVPITVNVRNTTPAATGDDGAANAAADALNTARNVVLNSTTFRGSDIYGNLVSIVVGGFDFGDVAPGATVTRTFNFTIPNDGTLHRTDDPGYRFILDLAYTDPATPALRIPVVTQTDENVKISVTPDLQLDNLTYTAGDYRAGDIITMRAVVRNASFEEDGRQTRPLRPNDDGYRLDTRLSIRAAFGEDAGNEFQVFFADFWGDGGGVPFAFTPNERSVIREMRVINTPTAPPGYGVLATASATITVGAGGSVTAVNITNGGLGYLAGEDIRIQAGQVTGGAQFLGRAVVNNFGQLTGVTIVNAGAGYQAGVVTLLSPQGRNYNPQPYDGFLDLGEEMEVVFEVRVPDNFPGVYFVCAQVDSLNTVTEPRPNDPARAVYPDTIDNNGAPRLRNNNTFISSQATKIRVLSSPDPQTSLVSGFTPTETVPGGVYANNPSDLSVVSGSGEVVAFTSFASNLLSSGVPTNGRRQIFARQANSGRIELASADGSGRQGNANSNNPAVNAGGDIAGFSVDGGRFVAFDSDSSNLVNGDNNGLSDVFVRDLLDGRTVRVSVNSMGVQGNGGSFNPSISDNGRFVVFESEARNLDINRRLTVQDGSTLVFVHDRAVDGAMPFDRAGNVATYLVSISSAGAPANQFTFNGRISGNGEYVAFVSYAFNLPGGTGYEQVYRTRLAAGGPVVGSTQLVSVSNSGAPGNARSNQPSINGDGHQIAFSSEASNLVDNDTNLVADIFVRSVAEQRGAVLVPVNRTVRVSVSNPRSATGTITFVNFASRRGLAPANNPVAGDTVTISDGVLSVVFEFGRTLPETETRRNVVLGANGGATRDNLVEAINRSSLDVTAVATTPPPQGAPKAPYTPSIFISANTPGAQANQLITDTSNVIISSGLRQGGTQAEDPQGLPQGVPSGSITPSIDRSGRLVAFRSVAFNLTVFEPTVQNNFLPRGSLIRPLLGGFADIYVHDRRANGVATDPLDVPGNTNTEVISLSTYGDNTNALLGVQSSGNNQQPSISADGRFVSFSSDSENTAGLLFGKSNLVPLDFNNYRDIFLRNRNVPGSLPIGSPEEAFVRSIYPILLDREPSLSEVNFFVNKLKSGQMQQADVVITLTDFNATSTTFGANSEYGRTTATALAPFKRLGLVPDNTQLQRFLEAVASDPAPLPIADYPGLPGAPYGATVGLARAMQDIFESPAFASKYPGILSLSDSAFVAWLRDSIFPGRSLGQIQLLPPMMQALPLVRQGAAMAFLSRLVVVADSSTERLFQRELNSTALRYLLGGGWDNAYGIANPYSKPVVEALLAQYPVVPSSVGGAALASLPDFTGDGKSDILWRHGGNGQVLVWTMNGTTAAGMVGLPSVAEVAWQVAGTGDFSGDGKVDILWRHGGDGRVLVWTMNGTTVTGVVGLPTVADWQWQIGAVGDLTGDGKVDIVWQHRGNGAVHVWEMNGTTPVRGINLPAVGDLNWQVATAADMSGDGKVDIVWQHRGNGAVHVWEMNGTTPVRGVNLPVVGDLGWRIGMAADMTGDGRNDLVWRHGVDGRVVVWEMNGTVLVRSVDLPPVADTAWEIGGTSADRYEVKGDLTGDRWADILWQHRGNGQVHVWAMNGATPVAGINLPVVGDLNWRMGGIGDFSGDGWADILWRHGGNGQVLVWTMNATTLTGVVGLPPVADLNWQVAGTGDFNGDGKVDILWRHGVDGRVLVWTMNGTTLTGVVGLPTVSDLNWQVGAVGDLTGDGKVDILWRHNSNGSIQVWEMNGMTPVRGINLPAVADVAWQIVALGDGDGDGWLDILWRNSATGAVLAWQMEGTRVKGASNLPAVPDLNWRIYNR